MRGGAERAHPDVGRGESAPRSPKRSGRSRAQTDLRGKLDYRLSRQWSGRGAVCCGLVKASLAHDLRMYAAPSAFVPRSYSTPERR